MNVPTAYIPSGNQVDKEMEADAAFDKFATLFSPATPRASPTLLPIQDLTLTEPLPMPRPHPPLYHSGKFSNSSDSEFGSFVSVPASEDPLSSFVALDAVNLESGLSTLEPSQIRNLSHSENVSLNFFDKFVQDAKLASERNKRDVLAELLLHEDDPLYWLKDQTADPLPDSIKMEDMSETSSVHSQAIDAGRTGREATTRTTLPVNMESSLLDLDLIAPKFTVSSSTGEPAHTQSTSPRAASRSASSSPRLIRRRSSSLHPPTLAPPIATTPSVTSSLPTPSEEIGDLLDPKRQSPPRSTSYQTLSNLSSKWMSSFLASSPPTRRPNSSSASTKPHVDSILSSSASEHSTIPAKQIQANQPHHSSTLFSSSTPTSHGTPFAPSTTGPNLPFNSSNISGTLSSPFAPHVYIPPSGAPGFAGDAYDWDKGYSRELELEMKSEMSKDRDLGGADNKQRTGPGRGISGNSSRDEQSKPGKNGKTDTEGNMDDTGGNHALPARSIGGLIEKKSGSVELRGRRATTVGVLTVALADLIRPHLPALSRLARAWTLLYSLDQHGISINTLYYNCDVTSSTSPLRSQKSRLSSESHGLDSSMPGGALLIVKDTEGALFGVWMGGGIKMSKGKGYYGSGESFLWRCVQGKVQIFNWSGKNDYVALCEPEYLSFGGGDGHAGLYLDDTLLDGTSAPCPTFDNEPLCSPGEKKSGGTISFECVGFEVWAT